jgi:hypothetical protein
METSLHRQLKQLYARGSAVQESRIGDFRIDVVRPGQLVEIQHGSLAAIRRKVELLLPAHRVLVVKPIVVRKHLVRCATKDGPELGRRLSPKRGDLLSLFDELVHFTSVFPHPNLRVEAALVEIEEWRYTGHGRRRRWRRDDFQIADQKLVRVHGVEHFQAARDLLRLIPPGFDGPFHTGDLSDRLGIRRSAAQRITYCLRHCGAVRTVGKIGNALLYEASAARTEAGPVDVRGASPACG